MERIKQALERAREQQRTAAPRVRPPRQNTPPQSELNITYTQTKTVPIEMNTLRQMRVVAMEEVDPVADAYKVLRTQLLKRLRANNWNSLAITSPTEGDGKTLTAINLAISLAREVNHTVLLVDLDLRWPKIRSYFPSCPELGISDYITNQVELNSIMFNPGIERLVILPGHKAFASSSETLCAPKMVQLVQELKNRYPSRIILFDLPPVLSCDDVIAFAPHLDAALVVVEDGKTKRKELKRTMELLDSINVLGTVLNKSSEEVLPHYY